MLVRLIILIFSGSLLLFFSCRKNSNTISNSQLVGKWVWVSDNIGNQVLTDTLNSAVRKSIFFKGNGVFILTHNDSTSNGSTLQVISNLVVLPVAVSDTGSFQIFLQTYGCVNLNFQALGLSGRGGDNGLVEYQYTISNDTLSLSNSPCLAPFEVTFIKKN